MQEAKRRREAELRRQAELELERQRLAAEAAARARASATPSPSSNGDGLSAPAPDVLDYVPPPADASKGAQVVAIALQYLGIPFVWGCLSITGLRLFRAHDVCVRGDWDLAAPSRGDAVHRRGAGFQRPASTRRPHFLPRPRPHGDVHRWRRLHPCPAHRRHRQDLAARGSVLRLELGGCSPNPLTHPRFTR